VPADRLLVTESGILGRRRGAHARAGVHAFLVGEAFMRARPGRRCRRCSRDADDLPAAFATCRRPGAHG
jgi:hypothetical protein